MTPSDLVFVKLGGAAITDKTKPLTSLPDRIANLADQIAPGVEKPSGDADGDRTWLRQFWSLFRAEIQHKKRCAYYR